LIVNQLYVLEADPSEKMQESGRAMGRA